MFGVRFWKKKISVREDYSAYSKEELIRMLVKAYDELGAAAESNRVLKNEKKILESEIDAHKAAIDQLSAVVHRDRLRVQNEQKMYGGYHGLNRNSEANNELDF